MKFKRLILSATAVAASSSLLATVLTSCAKADIDEDLIVKLNDDGLFGTVGEGTGAFSLNYQDAIKAALSRSSGWKTFKEALADEIVYQWYEDRASTSLKSKDKNDEFRKNLEEWKYKSEEEYNKVVDKCKSTYGANFNFYLQNDYLSQYGGTKDSYIHSKMVNHVKEVFTKAVFEDNFFGYRTDAADHAVYPQIFTEATSSVDVAALNDPANWSKLGFYAKTKVGYEPKEPTNDLEWPNYLAANPEGDYAAIQDYVFNRWFADEKPFFSAAALFKYTKPTSSGSELADIYDPNKATLPTDGPNEAFPFFGGIPINSNDGEKGVNAYWDWYQNLKKGAFLAAGMYEDAQGKHVNNTITIPLSSTDDSQTLLLCSANDMFNTLYTPYAVAAANLYGRMYSTGSGLGTSLALNTYTQTELAKHVSSTMPEDQDDDTILKNFFWTVDPSTTAPTGVTVGSYLDLNDIYGGAGTNTYHCPLFKNNDTYKYFYGGTDGNNGVRYIINNWEIDLAPLEAEETTWRTLKQPWAIELNQSGVHAQTIDGYLYVRSGTSAAGRLQKAKEVLKYRAMQKYCNYDGGLISCDLFTSDSGTGRLEKYFTDHYADIILELAMKDNTITDKRYNVFRTIDSYKKDGSFALDNLFLYKINSTTDQVLTSTYADLVLYLKNIITVDWYKKVVDAVEAVNDKIYSYRSTQITNSKSDIGKKRFENGLLGRMPLDFVNSSYFRTSHHYLDIITAIYVNNKEEHFLPNGETDLYNQYKTLILAGGTGYHAFINEALVGKNADLGFSPQIEDAQDAMSNRFWYNSPIVDKVMYAFMADKGNANAIKNATYEAYDTKVFGSSADTPKLTSITNVDKAGTEYNHAFYSTYAKSKLFSDTKNFSAYTLDLESNFYTTMSNAYANLQQSYKVTDGDTNDEALNFKLFISTISYLARPDADGTNYFHNFNKWLDSKILNNETAYVGYLEQFNVYHKTTHDDPIEQITSASTLYDWTSDVGNIYDRLGYVGEEKTEGIIGSDNFLVESAPYWNVIQKKFDNGISKTFAGFTGLQTAKNNIFDSASGLQAAAFGSDDGLHNFAQSTDGSPNLNVPATEYVQNQGALFPWAGSPKSDYVFADFADPAQKGSPINSDDIAAVSPFALKLAHTILKMDNKDDLLDLATKLANAIYGKSYFRKIVTGETELYRDDIVNSLRYHMLEAILEPGTTAGTFRFAKAFDRVRNVELHADISQQSNYSFKNGADGYKVMLTQINKSDVTDSEQLLLPEWESGKWQMKADAPITIEEFWFLLCNAACDTANQQLATADAVKEIFGPNKLIVYDAQLYNQFDSVWIKDWVKKPIGGGSE